MRLKTFAWFVAVIVIVLVIVLALRQHGSDDVPAWMRRMPGH